MSNAWRGTWLIFTLGFLIPAALFDDPAAMTISGSWRHDPSAFSAPMHLLAIASMVTSLWPSATDIWSAVRQRRAHWAMAGIAGVVAMLVQRGPLVAALSAFAWAVGAYAWRITQAGHDRRPTSNRSANPRG